MDLPTKTQLAICKYMDVPAAEAQSRYVQMIESEHQEIAYWANACAAGLSVPNKDVEPTINPETKEKVYPEMLVDRVIATAKICGVWIRSCERRKADAETKEILPAVAEAATDVEGVENTGIELAKELAAE